MALMPVTDALSAVLAGAEPLFEEMVALDAAHHRVLARDVAALRTQPPQAMSAMDGYAVRSTDAADLTARLTRLADMAERHIDLNAVLATAGPLVCDQTTKATALPPPATSATSATSTASPTKPSVTA